MKNSRSMTLEFHGQLEQFTKADEKREAQEIAEHESKRKQVIR